MKKSFCLFICLALLANYASPLAMAQSVDRRILEDPVGWCEQQNDSLRSRISELRAQLQTEQDPVLLTRYRQELEELTASVVSNEKCAAELVDAQQRIYPSVAPNDAIRVVIPAPIMMRPSITSFNVFLAKVRADELEFADLIEYADPISDVRADQNRRIPNDLRTVIYATEMIGNTLEAIPAEPDPETLDYVLNALVAMQPRLMYQLYNLEKTYFPSDHGDMLKPSTPQEAVMAIGTLRIALLKINQFYQRMNLENPVKFSKGQQNNQQFSIRSDENPAVANHQNPQLNYEELTAYLERCRTNPALQDTCMYVAPPRPTSPNYSAGIVTEEIEGMFDPYERILFKFKNELRMYAAHNKNLKERNEETWSFLYKSDPHEQTHYNNAQLLTEYATLYAILYGGDALNEIVAVFDTGWHKKGNNGPYIFTEYDTSGAPFLNTVFTTLFETVRYSKIYTPKAKNAIAKLKDFSDKTKHDLPTVVFALEAASLMFAPHNGDYRTEVFTPEQERQAQLLTAQFNNFFRADPNDRALFAARVADIYCTLKTTNHQEFGLDSSQMEQLANKLADIYNNFYDITSETVTQPGVEGHPHPRTTCEISMRGNLNQRVRDAEDREAVLVFAAECIFWTYAGGPLFSALGNAFRMARGAIAVLPKARQAFNAARMGQKTSAAFQVIQRGARGSNLVSAARANNITLVRAVPTQAPAKTAAVVPAGGPQVAGELAVADARATGEAFVFRNNPVGDLTVELKPVTSVRNLTQGRSRWLGRKLDPEQNVFALQSMPDGSMNILKLEDPFFFRGKSFDQLTLDAFVPVEGSGPLQTSLSVLERQTAQQRSVLVQSLINHPPFEPYVPLKNGKWWNLRWGRPAQDNIAWDFANQPVTLVPSGAFARGPEPFKLRSLEELLSKGAFESSALEVKTGAWANRAVNTYFTQMDYAGSKVGQFFLPHFVLNNQGATALSNSWSFGASLLKTIPHNQLLQTTLGFGMLHVIDTALYPSYKGYLASLAQADLAEEKAKYPELAPDLLAQDNLYNQLKNGLGYDPRQMNTYPSVMASKKQRKLGTSIIFPIVALKRTAANMGIGTFNAVDEGTRRQLERSAIMLPFRRSLREQAATREVKHQQALETLKNQQVGELNNLLQQQMEARLQEPWVLILQETNPQAVTRVRQILLSYNQAIRAIFEDTNTSKEQKHNLLQQEQDKLAQSLAPFQQQADEQVLNMLNSMVSVAQSGPEQWQIMWVDFASDYRKSFLEENPTISEYPELMEKLDAAFHLYVDAKVALYNAPEDGIDVQHQQIDDTLVDSLNAIAAELQQKEELLSDPQP